MHDGAVDLLIIGASARAAASSSLRAGLTPLCLDIFADLDLSQQCRVQRIDDYPTGLVDALESLPPMPVVYLGGLENHADVLRTVESSHELWGNPYDTVAKVRDLSPLTDAMRIAQVTVPTWRSIDDPPDTDGTWLVRSKFGSGGNGLSRWTPESQQTATLDESHVFQKIEDGIPYSAAYIANPFVGDVRFIGVTRQLIGEAASNAKEFQWSGNIGPATLSVPVEHKMRRVGNILKWKFGLTGLFGVDFLVTEDEKIFVTEVNPRYPASLDLLEFATGQALFEAHARCFREEIAQSAWSHDPSEDFFGRAILYASADFTLASDLSSNAAPFGEFPSLADIPSPGQKFITGDAICSIYESGKTADDCQTKLAHRLQELQSALIP